MLKNNGGNFSFFINMGIRIEEIEITIRDRKRNRKLTVTSDPNFEIH
jgi:hypothetical protein